MVFDENSTAFELASPTVKVSFLSHYFQEFSLSSVFRILTIICLGMNFFRFILFGIHSTALICMFTSFTKFGKFLPSLNTCSVLLSWDSNDKNIRSFVIVLQFIFGIFFSLLFRLGNFYCFIFLCSSLFCFQVYSLRSLVPFWYFRILRFLFVLYISVSLLRLSVSLLRLFIFSFVSSVFIIVH